MTFLRDGEQIIDFRGAWEKACKDSGIAGKIFHDLHRTGVRNMVRAGVQEQVAMRISGNKTRAVFYRYNIVSPEDLKEAASRIGRFHEMVTETVTTGNSSPKTESSTPAQVIGISR